MNERKTVFQAAAAAGLLAFVAVIVQAGAALSLPGGVQVQPSAVVVSTADFIAATNDYTDTALAFFGADSLFVLCYVLVFTGLYAVTAERARPFALLGLGAGILAALMDATENALFITYALGARAGLPLTNPDVPLLYVLTNLKWMGAFAALLAFGLVFPRRTPLEWIIAALMLLFPLVGVLGIAQTPLVAARGLFFLVGMPLFAWYFWRQSRAASPDARS